MSESDDGEWEGGEGRVLGHDSVKRTTFDHLTSSPTSSEIDETKCNKTKKKKRRKKIDLIGRRVFLKRGLGSGLVVTGWGKGSDDGRRGGKGVMVAEGRKVTKKSKRICGVGRS